jgi:hypothetical protein
MFEATVNGEEGQKQDCGLNLLQVMAQLEKEKQLLSDEKADLMEIEAKLWLMIDEEVEDKRTKNEELRMEVAELRRKCEELTRVLNATIREL